MKELKIIEEKYLNEEKTEYLFSYKIDEALISFNSGINTSKIIFDTIFSEPKIFYQKSKKMNEDSYVIQYKYNDMQSDDKQLIIPPAVFIFLLDQSGSMRGSRISIAKKALEIFLIGFGSKFRKYDEVPKEYTKKNIEQTLYQISQLNSNLGGTNIYNPLKNIYEDKIYNNIKLKRKIFLLTDGAIENRNKTLELIKEKNSKFNIFAIGVGDKFDEFLIRKAGFYGKGSSNYCRDMNELNSIISR